MVHIKEKIRELDKEEKRIRDLGKEKGVGRCYCYLSRK